MKKIVLLNIILIIITTFGLYLLLNVNYNKKEINNFIENKLSKEIIILKNNLEKQIDKGIIISKNIANNEILNKWFENKEENKDMQEIALSILDFTVKEYDVITTFAINKHTGKYWMERNRLFDVVNKSDPNDQWFFNSLATNDKYQINIDYNSMANCANIWFNFKMKNVNNPNGIAGIGLTIKNEIYDIIKNDLTINSIGRLINNNKIIASINEDENYYDLKNNFKNLKFNKYDNNIMVAKTDNKIHAYSDIDKTDFRVYIEIPINDITDNNFLNQKLFILFSLILIVLSSILISKIKTDDFDETLYSLD